MTVGNGGLKDIQGKYKGVTIITENTRAIHDGEEFSIDADGTLLKAATLKLLGITGDKQVHFDEFFGKFSQGAVRISLYEAPTITANGTPILPVCSNFEIDNTAELAVHSNPTTTANGTFKAKVYLPRTGGGANVSGAEGGIAGGRVLKRNTAYLFLIENLDANVDNVYGINFTWHESDIILN
jgi:hypothetical protein